MGLYGDLGTGTSLPGNCHDLHSAIIDLRNLQLKQPLDQIPVSTGDFDDGLLLLVGNAGDVYLDGLPLLEYLAGDLLVPEQIQLRLVIDQGHGAPARLHLGYGSGNALVLLVLELGQQILPADLSQIPRMDCLADCAAFRLRDAVSSLHSTVPPTTAEGR